LMYISENVLYCNYNICTSYHQYKNYGIEVSAVKRAVSTGTQFCSFRTTSRKTRKHY